MSAPVTVPAPTDRVVGRPLDGLLAASALLTRLPVRVPTRSVGRTGAAWFPLVGTGLGAGAAATLAVLAPVDPSLAAVGALGLVALVTGALHLDGLADTADALLAPDAERAEAARRDPRVGAGGVVALVLVLGIQGTALAAALRAAEVTVVVAGLVAVLAASRLVPVVLALAARRGDPADPSSGTGFGAWFAARVSRADAVAAAAITAIVAGGLALATGSVVVGVAAAGAAAVGVGMGTVLLRRRGGLDGDLLGAATELAVVGGFVALAAGLSLGLALGR